MITVIAKFNVESARVDEFKRCITDVVSKSKRERGCLSYTVFQSRDGAPEFTFLEEWLNDTVIEQHNESAHFKAFTEKISDMLTAPAQIKQLSKLPSAYF